jgi:hypothetical protein
MKKCLFFITMLILVLLSTYSFAADIYRTKFVEGSALISIDGDLSDWGNINLPEVPINNLLMFQGTVPPRSVDDLSASFKCFADANYVYVAVIVTDDNVVIGNHEYGLGWNDDAVEVCFDGDLKDISKPYFDINDGQVRVTADKNGVTLIEGAMPFLMETQPPYFWEARGVLGGFKQTTKGYTVEIAIPLKVLGWSGITSGKAMGMNIRVFDDDNEENKGMLDSGLSWIADPQNTSFWKTQYYNQVTFSEAIKLPGISKQVQAIPNTIIVASKQARELVIGLGQPDHVEYNELLNNVLTDMSEDKWDAAAQKLDIMKDKMWAQPLLGIIQFQTKKYGQSMSLFKTLGNNSPDGRVRAWAKNQPSKYLSVINTKYKNDSFKDGIKALQDIIPNVGDVKMQNESKLSLARLYFYDNDFVQAEKACKELLNSITDPTIKLNANMIILSIERKTYKK